MAGKRIKLYNDTSTRWRTAFDQVASRLVAAEAKRLGEAFVQRDELLEGREDTEHLAEANTNACIYWRSYLGVSTSPESGFRKRLNRAASLPDQLPRNSLKRVILAFARDLPRDCEDATAAAGTSLGASGVHFEIWEPKDIRRRIYAAFGITCPAVHLNHLEELLRTLAGPSHATPSSSSTGDRSDEPLGTLFVSYASEDRAFVEKLIGALDPFVGKIWYDHHEILVGDSIVARINDGLAAADHVIAVLSRASVDKPWVQSEIAAALMRQNTQATVRVLPVMKEECNVPPLLQSVRFADFTVHFESGLNELLLAIRGVRVRNAIGGR
jgi:hypothetical protein